MHELVSLKSIDMIRSVVAMFMIKLSKTCNSFLLCSILLLTEGDCN